jgi:Berberine and berberine like
MSIGRAKRSGSRFPVASCLRPALPGSRWVGGSAGFIVPPVAAVMYPVDNAGELFRAWRAWACSAPDQAMSNLQRLAEAKKRDDPGNLFRLNNNITPAH